MLKFILVVDDDLFLAYAIQSYLSSSERKVFIVNNALYAMKLLKLYVFDLVISDIMMSICDGYQLLYYVRRSCYHSLIPFVFLTAKGMTLDRIKGYSLGCNAYIVKPFHPYELLSIVNNILNSIFKYSKLIKRTDSCQERKNKIVFTSRELTVLKLLMKGMMNKEIASNLNLSVRNVEKYVSRLLHKTQKRNRTELVQFSLSSLLYDERANDGTRTRE